MNIFVIIIYIITVIIVVALILLIVFRKKLALKKLHSDAEKGHISAQIAVAGYYLTAEHKDTDKAIDWLKKAAEKGSPEAQAVLGTIYGDGQLIPQNQEESLKWFLQGAMNGNVFAQKTVAGVYHFSVGLDRKIAYAWYETAAVKGDGHSKDMAERLMNEFSQDEKNVAKDIALEYIKHYSGIKK